LGVANQSAKLVKREEQLMVNARVERIGEHLAVILDSSTRESLGVSEGDLLTLSKPANDPAADSRGPRGEVIERGRAILLRYRETFEALAR
jgi:hypothetical protein